MYDQLMSRLPLPPILFLRSVLPYLNFSRCKCSVPENMPSIRTSIPRTDPAEAESDDIKIVDEFCRILEENPCFNSLKKMAIRFEADHVVEILRRSEAKTAVLFEFFNWMDQQKWFRHTLHSYSTMIHLLCSDGMYSQANSLINVLVSIRGLRSAGCTMQALIDTQISCNLSEPSPFGMLLVSYGRSGMLADSIECLRLLKKNQIRVSLRSCHELFRYLLLNLNSLKDALRFYEAMLKEGVNPCVYSYNMIINSFCKKNRITEARQMFEEMKRNGKGIFPTAVTFNTLIDGYCKKDDLRNAIRLFLEMKRSNVRPDVVTYSVLINKHCKAGRLKEANGLFEEMNASNLRADAIVFTSLIDGCCKAGLVKEALKLHGKMRQMRVRPDVVAYNALMNGLCMDGQLKAATELMDEMKKTGVSPDNISYTILLDGFCKGGNLEMALRIQSEMAKNGTEMDMVAYTALVTGFARHGRALDAYKWLQAMLGAGLVPDDATYTSVIDAFCRIGALSVAFKVFKEMQDTGKKPNVILYNVLINGLCKNGHLQKADRLLDIMIDKGLVPDDVTYNTLIHAHCQKDKSEAFQKLRDETGLISDYAAYRSLLADFEGNISSGKDLQ